MKTDKKLKVGVIFGGMSSECEPSLASGRYVYSVLDASRFEGVPIYIDKKGNFWKVPLKLVIQNTTLDVEKKLESDGEKIAFDRLPKIIDLAFITLFGKYGEDGTIQGILELLDIPYTGSGVLASALGMDKKIQKLILRNAGINVPKDVVFSKKDWEKKREKVVERVEKEVGYPNVVKPTREGSSTGVAVVKKREELVGMVKEAFVWDKEILVEEYLKGVEFVCVVWGNKNPKAMLPTEVVFEGDLFTYDQKYMPGRTQTITPARISDEMIKKLQDVVVKTYKILGFTNYARVDGFVVGEKVYIGDPHTGCIMVPSSFIFQQAAKFNLSIDQQFSSSAKKGGVKLTPKNLVTKIIEFAIEAHEEKKGPL